MDWLIALIGPDNGGPTIPQYCARALIVFAFGILCIRIAGRRSFSQASPLDIIVAIIIGSNLSRTMTGKASFLGGLAASLVIVVLHRVLTTAVLRWGWLERLIKGRSVVLVRDGRLDRAAMARHGVSEIDLMESLRMQEAEALAEVRLATLEDGGKISIIKTRR
jgi:uncharacterized membrane protein YcaP (DUF421 family)